MAEVTYWQLIWKDTAAGPGESTNCEQAIRDFQRVQGVTVARGHGGRTPGPRTGDPGPAFKLVV